MKEKFEIEYQINSSPRLLFQYISDPSSMSEWFAENVYFRGDIYTFVWSDSEEKAKLVIKKSDERVKYKWIDEEDNETDYALEIKIKKDDITKDVSLIISDYAEADEIENSNMLWDNLISDLKQILGS